MEADVGAVKSEFVVAVCSADMFCVVERFSEISADHILVSEFCTQGRAAQRPVEPAVQIHTEHIGAVIVERILVRGIADKFETVLRAVPVDSRLKVKPAALCFSLDGREPLGGLLVLVVKLFAIECVAAEAFRGESGVPSHLQARIFEASLIECFSAAIVHV